MRKKQQLNLHGTPESELKIDIALIHSLLQEQHPDLIGLPVYMVDNGWDNAIFRLGDQLLIRLPRRQAAAKLIKNEQIWLPKLALQLPIIVSCHERIGYPTKNYPWHWSILPWIPGVTAAQGALLASQATLWADFLRSLHLPAPANAPLNPVRGVPLIERSQNIEERLLRLEQKTNLITPKIKTLWRKAIATPVDVTAKWLHGDLHPRNILVNQGVIAGVIDWGDLTSGDIATDLASVWMLFSEPKVRQQVFTEYGNISHDTLIRAQGWAILFGVVLLDTGLIDNSLHAAIGKRILRFIEEDH